MLLETDYITSFSNGKTYQLQTVATCKTHNVIYLIQCQKCSQQYVGESGQALHERLNSHRSDVRLKKIEKSVSAHFNSPTHTSQDMKVAVIEVLRRNNVRLRRLWESHWITTLQTIHPYGINKEL